MNNLTILLLHVLGIEVLGFAMLFPTFLLGLSSGDLTKARVAHGRAGNRA